MHLQNALKIIAACATTTVASVVFSHEGHAMAGIHWHATDVWGFVAMAGVLALAIWLSRGGK